jgi:uncharacterized protein (TIGR02118 family)
MFLMFARFNFKSADLAAEDRNYFDNHVRLARQLPGVRMYLTGRLRETPRGRPDRYRAVVFAYDNADAGLNSLDCPVGAELMADSAAHIEGTLTCGFEGDVIVPFESRRPGQRCIVAAIAYNLAAGADPSRLRPLRDSIRRMPAVRGYMAGRAIEARGQKPERDWMEIRICIADGLLHISELIDCDQSVMNMPQIHLFEGEVQI